MFEYLEIPRAGLEFLPDDSGRGSGKIHYCWGQHFQDGDPSHGWFDPDLEQPEVAGPYHFAGYTNYVSNDYLFEIPAAWAEQNLPGARLASGRFRDGLWGGRGPALFAYAPFEVSKPPKRGARIEQVTCLLLYGVQQQGAIEIQSDPTMAMKSFSEADEWSGGAWLTAGDQSAVVLVGTKGTGKVWYGFANGVVYPTEGREGEVYPEVPDWPYDSRGWWSEGVEAQLIFFDPQDLAAVAKGEQPSFEPQPYAVLALDDQLFDPGFDLQRAKRYLVGAACFDRARGLLYVVERMVGQDDEKSLVHAWKVGA